MSSRILFLTGVLALPLLAGTIRVPGDSATIQAGLNGAPPGDLYIFLSVQPHRLFQRNGADIFCRVPIPMTTAALGGTIEVPTIDGGRSRVKVPAGSQSGKQMRLRQKGMPMLRGGGVGDMYLELAVETPVNLTSEQRDILEKFDESLRAGGEKHSPRAGGWLDTVKRFFDRISS